jgi:hypothetical protein
MLEASSAFLNETSFLFRGSITTYTTCLIYGLQHDVSGFLIAILEASSAFLNETSFLFRGSITTFTTCLICSLASQRVLAMPIPTSSSSSNDPPIPLHSLFDAMLF